ncbi:MAG: ferritin family protein [Desulfobulbaceae bacterium]|nr:ferritin family protein [Desulfobulbaceae bacterium]
MASLFAGSRPYFETEIFNLSGGILSWNDYTLPDFPRMRIFPLQGDPADIFLQAMDLERGAELFYTKVLVRHREQGFARFIDLLARAEEGHARLIYTFYRQEVSGAPPFEELYGSLPGEVIEGGKSLEAMTRILDASGDESCLDIVEMAITIEYAAYDLYRNMADYFTEPKMAEAFLAIAQAEKEHMRIAAEALQFCENG